MAPKRASRQTGNRAAAAGSTVPPPPKTASSSRPPRGRKRAAHVDAAAGTSAQHTRVSKRRKTTEAPSLPVGEGQHKPEQQEIEPEQQQQEIEPEQQQQEIEPEQQQQEIEPEQQQQKVNYLGEPLEEKSGSAGTENKPGDQSASVGSQQPPVVKKEEPSFVEEPMEPAASASASTAVKSIKQESVKKEEPAEESKPVISKTIETGRIYFFYRPRVQVELVTSIEDVQTMYVLLAPAFGSKGPLRLLRISRKRLPEIRSGRKDIYFAFVDKVEETMEAMEGHLEPKQYTTKTRGERHVGAAQPFGSGVYGLVDHHGHTHLAYILEVPDRPGEVQDEFNVLKQGSYVIQVKNPANPEKKNPAPAKYDNFEGLQEGFKAHYGGELQKKFHNTRFTSEELPAFLNMVGTQIILIGAKEDLMGELPEAAHELEELTNEDVDHLDEYENLEDKVFQELKVNEKNLALNAEAVLAGSWGQAVSQGGETKEP